MYSEKCRHDLEARRVRCVQVPGRGSQEERRQLQAHDGLAPVLVGQGPMPQERQHFPREDFDGSLDALLADVLFALSPSTIPAAEQQVRDQVGSMPISWTRFQATLDYCAMNYGEVESSVTGVSVEEVRALLGRLGDPATWAFLDQDNAVAPRLCRDRDLSPGDAEPLLRRQLEHTSRWDATGIQRTLGKHCIVLHLYSGRRRYGDLQFYLDQVTLPAGTVIHTVSIDIVVDKELGDVTKPATRAYWLHSIRSRWTLGLFTGPPCETWSVARARDLIDVRHGPRVIRTLEELWGVASTSLREGCQLQIGNHLLQFGVEGLFELYVQEGFGALEHPAEPAEPDAASIWRTTALRFLRSLPCIDVFRLHQGRLGAYSSKPTDLLAVRMPWLAQFLREWELTSTLPQTASIGRSLQGEFLTSRLKEYPPAMCCAISDSFAKAFSSLPVSTVTEVPQSFLSQCKALDVDLNTEANNFMGRDFAG